MGVKSKVSLKKILRAKLNEPLNIDVEELSKRIFASKYQTNINNSDDDELVITQEIYSTDEKLELIIGFKGKTDEGFTEVYTQCTPSELRIRLMLVPNELMLPLANALKGTIIELPSLQEAFEESRANKAKPKDVSKLKVLDLTSDMFLSSGLAPVIGAEGGMILSGISQLDPRGNNLLRHGIVEDSKNSLSLRDFNFRPVMAAGEIKLPSFNTNHGNLNTYDSSIPEIIKKVNEIGQIEKHGNFSAEVARGILQNGVGYTNSTSLKPIIGSQGAGPCVILIAYNALTKTAGCTHLDPLSDKKSIEKMFDELKGNNDEKLELHIRGGQSSFENEAASYIQLIKFIESINYAEVKSCNLMSSTFLQSKEMALDTRSGELFTQFNHTQLDEGADVKIRLDIVGLTARLSVLPNYERSLTLEYDGRLAKNQTSELVGTGLKF